MYSCWWQLIDIIFLKRQFVNCRKNNKKLSYRWETARHMCANTITWMTHKTRLSTCVSPGPVTPLFWDTVESLVTGQLADNPTRRQTKSPKLIYWRWNVMLNTRVKNVLLTRLQPSGIFIMRHLSAPSQYYHWVNFNRRSRARLAACKAVWVPAAMNQQLMSWHGAR